MSASRIIRRVNHAGAKLAQLVGAIALELRRLNRARLESDSFSTLAPRDRRSAVKAALKAHHSDIRRCC